MYIKSTVPSPSEKRAQCAIKESIGLDEPWLLKCQKIVIIGELIVSRNEQQEQCSEDGQRGPCQHQEYIPVELKKNFQKINLISGL